MVQLVALGIASIYGNKAVLNDNEVIDYFISSSQKLPSNLGSLLLIIFTRSCDNSQFLLKSDLLLLVHPTLIMALILPPY